MKAEDMIVYSRKAQAITDAVFTEIIPLLKPGVTEREMAAEILRRITKHGAEGAPAGFNPIVAFGAGTADIHHEPNDTELQPGDLIMIDFGCTVGGYASDMTRMLSCGQPSDEVRQVYDLVLRAQLAALAAARAGMTGKALDAVARDIITGAGYEFPHSLGHGVGQQIHQDPKVSWRHENVLPAGAVITIEPGIYLPGKFGVRIEDMVVLNNNGCENLTKSPKELIMV